MHYHPHSQKEHTELYKIRKFGANWANIEKHTAIQKLEKFIKKYMDIYNILIITGVQASGVIIDRLLRQCCFVWSEIVGPHSSGNFNDQRYIYI